jgi:hypothetical protein
MNKYFLTNVLIVVLMLFSIVLSPVFLDNNISFAQSGDDFNYKNCDPSVTLGGQAQNCTPPTLRAGGFLATQAVFALWSLGGIIFMLILADMGRIYMWGEGGPEQWQELKTRFFKWFWGFLLFFFAQPLVATLMSAILRGSDCYEDLAIPGFYFFFESVCT